MSAPSAGRELRVYPRRTIGKPPLADIVMIEADVRVTELFTAMFGHLPAATERAPARVNLLGEHTDSNDGFSLAMPVPYFTTVSIGCGVEPGVLEGHSCRFGGARRRLGIAMQGNWLDHVAGCIEILKQSGVPIWSVRVSVESDVPIGAGVSSSGALQVATLRALSSWLGLELDGQEIVRLAQRVQAEYLGVTCGTLDPVASAFGQPGHALFLDAADGSRELLPLPSGCAIAVANTGASDGRERRSYDERQSECRAAMAALGVSNVRDIGLENLRCVEALPDPLSRRVGYLITENGRVLEGAAALRSGDLPALGTLMVESHCSQRDEYETSMPAVDALVEASLRHGALGARLIGGGSGSVVALLNRHLLWEWWPLVARDCPDAWLAYPSPAGANSGRRAG